MQWFLEILATDKMLMLDARGMVSDRSNEFINSARGSWNIWEFPPQELLLPALFLPKSSWVFMNQKTHSNKAWTPGSKGSQHMPSSQFFIWNAKALRTLSKAGFTWWWTSYLSDSCTKRALSTSGAGEGLKARDIKALSFLSTPILIQPCPNPSREQISPLDTIFTST